MGFEVVQLILLTTKRTEFELNLGFFPGSGKLKKLGGIVMRMAWLLPFHYVPNLGPYKKLEKTLLSENMLKIQTYALCHAAFSVSFL